MKKLSVLGALLVLLVFFVLSPFAQETATTNTLGNVREHASTTSGIITTISAGTEVTIIDTVTGTTVSDNALWYYVQLPDGRTGYMWTGLFQNEITTLSSEYPLFVCENCQYHTLEIIEMHIGGRGVSASISTPQIFFDSLYEIPARNLWVGYGNGGYALPTDKKFAYWVEFIVAEQTIPGPLMFQGEVLPSLRVQNDEAQIWFWHSESTGEGYVLPFRSMTRTCTAQGIHCGEHLLGVYAVPWEEVEMLMERYR